MKKRVVVADAHASVRQLLAMVLEETAIGEVVAEARTGFEAIHACRRHRPDLLILDVTLPELCGAEVTRRLHAERLPVGILLYTAANSRRLLLKAFRYRPNGLIRREDSLQDLIEAIRVVAEGGYYFTALASELQGEAEDNLFSILSEREAEVLQLIAEGRTSKQIAELLGVATKTIENHRHRLMQKAGVHDIAGLTRYAVQQGVVG